MQLGILEILVGVLTIFTALIGFFLCRLVSALDDNTRAIGEIRICLGKQSEWRNGHKTEHIERKQELEAHFNKLWDELKTRRA